MKYLRIPSSTYALIFTATFLLDRVTKLLALQYAHTRIDVTSFLSFVLEYNRGISWGLFDSDDSRVFCTVSCIIAAIILGIALYTFVCWMNHQRVFGQILVMSGALSNLVDRVIHHGVVDFILVSYKGWSFPIFNVADACIVLGVALMLYEGLDD